MVQKSSRKANINKNAPEKGEEGTPPRVKRVTGVFDLKVGVTTEELMAAIKELENDPYGYGDRYKWEDWD
ncbi:hypothetical protein GF360_04020 [candidate division WWE3 bacterium]|nr:hypothetical protein [candidate division WWE3 bacterium]